MTRSELVELLKANLGENFDISLEATTGAITLDYKGDNQDDERFGSVMFESYNIAICFSYIHYDVLENTIWLVKKLANPYQVYNVSYTIETEEAQ